MKKLLLICLITFNLNIIAADHADAGTGAGVPEAVLSGKAEKKYLNTMFQAVLDVYTLAKQAKENLVPYGLELKLTTKELECKHWFARTRGKLYIATIKRQSAIPGVHLCTPWGAFELFNLGLHNYAKVKANERIQVVAKVFGGHLKLKQIDNLNSSEVWINHFDHGWMLGSAIVHEIADIDGRLLPVLPVAHRTEVECKADWEKRMSRHSAQSARWSEIRRDWLDAVLRGCLAREKALKAPMSVGVSLSELKKRKF